MRSPRPAASGRCRSRGCSRPRRACSRPAMLGRAGCGRAPRASRARRDGAAAAVASACAEDARGAAHRERPSGDAATTATATASGDGGSERRRGADGATRDDSIWLDPSARHAAQLAPPVAPATRRVDAARSGRAAARATSLEELLPALVRRIAWAGDRNKGTVRLELGAGAYAGTTVIVHADGGRVRVEIGGSEGPRPRSTARAARCAPARSRARRRERRR